MSIPQPARNYRYAFLLAWPFHSLGGVNGVVRNLLKEFESDRRFLPIAVEVFDEAAEGLPSREQTPWPLIRLGGISTWNPKRPWRSIAAFCVRGPSILWKLRSLCRKYSINVLNPHFIGLEYLPLVLLRRLGLFRGQLIFSLHGADLKELRQSRGLERRLSKMLLRGADYLVPCSEGLAAEIADFVPECAGRTVAVPNGIDAEAFLAGAGSPFELPPQYQSQPLILNIGAFEHKKGHDILLRSIGLLKEAGIPAVLVIAGQGSAASMASLAAELGISDRVLFLENQPHSRIAALLKQADVFVLSSRREGLPLSLLEAAAAARPVVATRIPGVIELLSAGDTGLMVPVDDYEAMARALTVVLGDPVAAVEMGKRFHAFVTANFSWRKAFRKYAALIEPSDKPL
jgi:glycosyltransferase involved in cell wall biosynthesis